MSLTKKIVTTYAKSLFQKIKNSQLGEEKRVFFSPENITSYNSKTREKTFIPDVVVIGEELLLLRSVILSSKKFQQFFQNPTYSEKQKLEVLFTIFPGLTLPLSSFLKILTERSHLSLIPEICDEYSKFLLEFKNCTKVKLITSTILQESFGISLFQSLKELTKSNSIILTVAYNPKLLGGFILEYKSNLIDLSLLKEFSLFFN